MADAKIIYTYTDEAPALATHSLLPVIRAYAAAAGVEVETRDISLAGRILATFPDVLAEDQRVDDALAELGELAKQPHANIIKLPNISASIPQLKAAIKELQGHGYALPDYPDEPATDEEREIQGRYDQVKGSAVNPVLRECNSDRRAPRAVKEYARKNPHSMGAWSSDSQTHVATMDGGDFQANEQSVTVPTDDTLRIEHVATDGTVTELKQVPVLAGEVVDATYMSKRALVEFLAEQVQDAKDQGLLFSLHMKATMMKVSDPIIFGHAVRVFFEDVFEQYGEVLEEVGADPTSGLGDVLAAIEELDGPHLQQAVADAIARAREQGPDLAMVNSHKDITGLHVPSDFIIDASMPAMVRAGGQMWNAADELQDAKATIPDSSYAGLYQATIDHCREHGAFDPTTMGTVPNVGLMAQKAEEYGSHDKTFEIDAPGEVRVVNGAGEVLLRHEVEAGDIWRACQVKDAPVRDWVKLAVRRARSTGWPTVFWLDAERAHDAQLITKVNRYLQDHDTEGLDIRIMNVREAADFSLERARNGQNTISVTGNVLRDYLTDLFPILEVGTSAKMLSIVPLMNGGGLFETGAGGSAPKHVQQVQAENHLRWDSLGEFLALAASLDHLADTFDNAGARVLGATLEDATAKLLDEGRSPQRKVNTPDNRSSHVWLALFWAEALAAQQDTPVLAEQFRPFAASLRERIEQIDEELLVVQGEPVDLGGYYDVPRDRLDEVMRPSETWNQILASFNV